jgi:hypothetical protein
MSRIDADADETSHPNNCGIAGVVWVGIIVGIFYVVAGCGGVSNR